MGNLVQRVESIRVDFCSLREHLQGSSVGTIRQVGITQTLIAGTVTRISIQVIFLVCDVYNGIGLLKSYFYITTEYNDLLK